MDEVNDKFTYAVEQMRMQRHDFMNYLQVIYGYLQINRPQEAIKYIKNVNNKMSILANVFNLNKPEIGLVMQEFFEKCSKSGIDIEFYTEIDYIDNNVICQNINEIRKLFDILFKAVDDFNMEDTEGSDKLYMSMYENPEEIIFIIGISNEIIEKIDIKEYNGYTELIYKNKEENTAIDIYKYNNITQAADIRLGKNKMD